MPPNMLNWPLIKNIAYKRKHINYRSISRVSVSSMAIMLDMSTPWKVCLNWSRIVSFYTQLLKISQDISIEASWLIPPDTSWRQIPLLDSFRPCPCPNWTICIGTWLMTKPSLFKFTRTLRWHSMELRVKKKFTKEKTYKLWFF
jgi:hypothetical protein